MNYLSTFRQQAKTRPLNDVVYTSPSFAKRIIEYFMPEGKCLDPCKGLGAFYDELPEGNKDWCEISEGKDFLQYKDKVDWIITNPPWSTDLYRQIARHSFSLSDNVVFLVRMHNVLGTTARHKDWQRYAHGLKEIVLCDWEEAGFPKEGFSLAAFHWQKYYMGDCRWTYEGL